MITIAAALGMVFSSNVLAQEDPSVGSRAECETDGGTWIEVYEGVGRPAGWFEDPNLPGCCVTAEELEKGTPAEQENDPAQVESATTQTELSLPPPATEPEPSTELQATQPAQAHRGNPQYTG